MRKYRQYIVGGESCCLYQKIIAGVGKSIQEHLPEISVKLMARRGVSIKIFVYVFAEAVQKNIL